MTTREQELEKALRAMVNANWLFEPEEANRAVRAARAVLSAPSSEQGEREDEGLSEDEIEHVVRMKMLAERAIDEGKSQHWAAAGEVLLLVGYVDRLVRRSRAARGGGK